jgi:hypothetical protein
MPAPGSLAREQAGGCGDDGENDAGHDQRR